MPQKIDCRNFRNWSDSSVKEYPEEISSAAGEICHFDLENHDDILTCNTYIYTILLWVAWTMRQMNRRPRL